MFSALLDTCVLVPSRARDVLLEAASAGIYRPLWSSEILAELDRTLRVLQAKRGMAAEETEAYLVRLFRQMETSFPDALVTDWESVIGAVHLPDPGDRHVVAAARAGRADVIVTDNVADFPPGALPAPLIRKSLDEFLIDSLDLYPGQVISAVHAVARRTGRSGPTMTARDIATYLQARGMPTFGERLLATSTSQATREQRQPRIHRSTTSGIRRQSARPRPGYRARSLPVLSRVGHDAVVGTAGAGAAVTWRCAGLPSPGPVSKAGSGLSPPPWTGGKPRSAPGTGSRLAGKKRGRAGPTLRCSVTPVSNWPAVMSSPSSTAGPCPN